MMNKITVLLAALLCVLSSYSQGPLDGFIDAPKAKNLAISLSQEKANKYYLANGDTPISGTFNSASLFYKHQFTKWLGIAVNVPVVNGELHDGNFYLKFGKTVKINDKLSLNGILGLGISGPLSNYEADNPDAIGQRAQSFNGRLITQLTYNNRIFLNLRVGHDETKLPTPSANLYSIKVGYYKNKWYADLWYEDITALGGKDYLGVGDLRPSTFRELGVSSSKIGGVIYHQTKDKLGFFFSSAQVIAGRNVRGNLRLSIGAVLKL